jgi:hypothetical protein
MTVYTWLIVLLVAASFLFHGNQRQSKKFIVIAFVLLFAVMGLRDVNAFGSDASGTNGSYPIIYSNAGNSEWSELSGKGVNNFNVGFSYLMKLIYVLTDGNYQAFITIISLFVVFSYMRFIRKYSSAPIQSVLCFLGLLYYTLFFDALKQAVAMTILLFAFDAIIEKKPVRVIIIVVFAALFHFPALVFLPAYWIGRMKVGRGYILLLGALLLITYLFRDQLLNLMLDAYGGEDIDATMEGIRNLRHKVVIMIVIVVFAALIRPPAPDDTVYNAMLMFAGVAIVLQTFCGYNNIFERLADYYFHTSIVLIPLIFEKNGKSRMRAIAGVDQRIIEAVPLVICAFAIWRFLSTVNQSGIYMPYRFLWQ